MSHPLNSRSYKHQAEKVYDSVGHAERFLRVGARKMRPYLLQVENVMVEIILQLLVCIVDAELLEAVGLKVLKAKNVQNTDGQTLHNSKNSNTDMRRKKGNLTWFKPQTIIVTNDKPML